MSCLVVRALTPSSIDVGFSPASLWLSRWFRTYVDIIEPSWRRECRGSQSCDMPSDPWISNKQAAQARSCGLFIQNSSRFIQIRDWFNLNRWTARRITRSIYWDFSHIYTDFSWWTAPSHSRGPSTEKYSTSIQIEARSIRIYVLWGEASLEVELWSHASRCLNEWRASSASRLRTTSTKRSASSTATSTTTSLFVPKDVLYCTLLFGLHGGRRLRRQRIFRLYRSRMCCAWKRRIATSFNLWTHYDKSLILPVRHVLDRWFRLNRSQQNR